MKYLKILIISLLLLSCYYIQAQSKWFIAPLVGVAAIDNNFGYNTNLTLGRYVADIGNNGRFRTDICAGYFGFSTNKIYSASAILTGCDDGSSKWYYSVSLGFGIQKSENRSKNDFIIPIRMTIPYTAYRFNDKVCLGFDWAANLHLSDFRAGTPVYLGLFLGIGL